MYKVFKRTNWSRKFFILCKNVINCVDDLLVQYIHIFNFELSMQFSSWKLKEKNGVFLSFIQQIFGNFIDLISK